MAERQAVGVDGRLDLGVRAGERARQRHDVDVGDDEVGLAQQGGRAQGQQVGVTGADRDERDGTDGPLAARVVLALMMRFPSRD